MILSFIKKFDLLGAKPVFKINNEKSYTTFFGVFLTLICVSLSIISIYSTFLDFVNRTNANIVTTNSYDTEAHNITSDNFDFMIFFLSYDPKSSLAMPIPRQNIRLPPMLSFQTNMGRVHIVNNTAFMSECDMNKYLNDSNINPLISYYCIPKNYSFIVNSTANSAGSAVYSISLLPEYYSNITNTYPYFIVTLRYKKLVLQADNYINPYTYKWTDFSLILQKGQASAYQHIIENTNINIIDPSFIFQVKRPTETALLSLDPVMIFSSAIEKADLSSIPALQIQFVKNLNAVSYSITYVQFDAVVSTFGATFNVFYFVFAATYSFFCENFVKVFLINHVFKFHSYENNESSISKIKAIRKNISNLMQPINNYDNKEDREDKEDKEKMSVITNTNNIRVYEIRGETKSINNFVSLSDKNSDRRQKLSFSEINKERSFSESIMQLKEYRKEIYYSMKKHFRNEIICCNRYDKKGQNYHLLNRVIESTLSYERILQIHFDIFQMKQLLIKLSQSKHGLENPSLNMDDNEFSTDYLKKLLEKNLYDWTSDEVIREVDENKQDLFLKKYFIQSWS